MAILYNCLISVAAMLITYMNHALTMHTSLHAGQSPCEALLAEVQELRSNTLAAGGDEDAFS